MTPNARGTSTKLANGIADIATGQDRVRMHAATAIPNFRTL